MFTWRGSRDKQIIKTININKRYNNRYKDFYVENPHTNCGDKKPRGLRLLIKIHYMRSSYTNLPYRFTLKTYPLVPTTWSTSMTQQPLIAPVNTLEPRWRDAGLQP